MVSLLSKKKFLWISAVVVLLTLILVASMRKNPILVKVQELKPVKIFKTPAGDTVADLGQIRSRGASAQLGFPLRGSRYTRLFVSYAFEQSSYDSPTLTSRFYCDNCLLSSASLSLVRDTRVELPFPTGGATHRLTLAQGGGPLGGTGNFRRLNWKPCTVLPWVSW